MSVEENKASARRVIEEVFNKRNLTVTDELIDPTYIYHVPGGIDFKGVEGFKQFVNMYLTAFPDMHATIEGIVAEGDIVAIRVTYTGTHNGELMGIAPTGKQLNMTGAVFSRFSGGKQVEAWPYADQLTMYQQLGIPIPSE